MVKRAFPRCLGGAGVSFRRRNDLAIAAAETLSTRADPDPLCAGEGGGMRFAPSVDLRARASVVPA